MSQVDVATRSPIQSRAQTTKARIEDFVKTFEWTWTNAVLFSLALVFFLMMSAAVLPSFWMYFAEQKLGWGGPTDLEVFLKAPLSQAGRLELRDAIAMGLTTGPIVTVLVASAAMQNWRRKLRGTTGDTRPTGGYR
jgi:cobalamin synthase